MADFGVPPLLAGPLAFLVPAGELTVAVVLLGPGAWWGAVGALTLLSAFIIAIAVNLMKGRTPACNCFGQIGSKPIGWLTLVRNVVLALCGGLIVWAGPSHARSHTMNTLAAALQLRPFALVITGSVLAALAAETMFLWQLFRQHGRVLVRMDHLEQRLAPGWVTGAVQPEMSHGLAIGTPAPSFKLSTLSGTTLGLEALLRGYRAVLLIFSNPGCQPCTTLWPEIKRWQRDAAETVRIAVVSGGSAQANRVMTEQYALEDVLLQNEREVAELYAVQGTPGAVLIRADGTIGSLVAMGGAAITSLFTTAMESLVVGVAQEKPTTVA